MTRQIVHDHPAISNYVAAKVGLPVEQFGLHTCLGLVDHALNITGYLLLAAEMGARGQAIYERSWALDAQIKAAASKEDLEAIDLEAGWPV